LRAALADVPGQRPAARDWGGYLQFRVTGERLPQRPPAAPVSAGRPATVATTGWVRNPATGQWTRR